MENNNTNPLIKDDIKKDDVQSIYSDKDKDYISHLQTRIQNAKNQKYNPSPEFNNKTYYSVYEQNEKVANTMLPQKIDQDDVVVSAGTVESKLDALLANINNLDLTAEYI